MGRVDDAASPLDRDGAAVNSGTEFTVSVPEEQLNDLRSRLLGTRWPDDLDNDDWSYGTNKAYLRDLVEYWADGFDWRAAEAAINTYEQHRVDVDGVTVHFIRKRGVGPAPIPIVLTHGWPWTFWDWSRVIDPLADPGANGGDPGDAFEVIVPSLPGFGFSTPSTRADLNPWKVADIWDRLMTEVLEYRRYAASGSDQGAIVTEQLGHKYADNLYGIHLGHAFPLDILCNERPWDITGGQMVPEGVSPQVRDEIIAFQKRIASHVAVNVLDSQSLAYALMDSPVGLLGWLLVKLRNWSDCGGDLESVFPRDHILTNATIWWVTGTIGSSMRMYANLPRYPWRPAHRRTPVIEAPTGITFLGYENPPGVSTEARADFFRASPDSEMFKNIVHLGAHPEGGHFGPFENPTATISDIRTTFRSLR